MSYKTRAGVDAAAAAMPLGAISRMHVLYTIPCVYVCMYSLYSALYTTCIHITIISSGSSSSYVFRTCCNDNLHSIVVLVYDYRMRAWVGT